MYQAHIFELLQSSVSPVVMISGIGLLLLSMTNRFSRPVDAWFGAPSIWTRLKLAIAYFS